jgi:hypothetical protein
MKAKSFPEANDPLHPFYIYLWMFGPYSLVQNIAYYKGKIGYYAKEWSWWVLDGDRDEFRT